MLACTAQLVPRCLRCEAGGLLLLSWRVRTVRMQIIQYASCKASTANQVCTPLAAHTPSEVRSSAYTAPHEQLRTHELVHV